MCEGLKSLNGSHVPMCEFLQGALVALEVVLVLMVLYSHRFAVEAARTE